MINLSRNNLSATIKGLILGLLFVGTVSFGQFLAPPGTPYSATGNVPAPIDTSNSAQIKKGDLGVNYFVANRIYLGSNYIDTNSGFWPSAPVATTCQLESKKIFNNTTNLNVYQTPCEDMLSLQAKNAGWVSTSFEYCTSLSSGSCNGQAQCHYMRLVCSGSATTTSGTYARYTNYPVTAGDSYTTFMRDPQCNDGVDNGDPDALVDFNGAADNGLNRDPECSSYADDDEST